MPGQRDRLKAKGYSDSYVNRVLSVGRAALNRAYERGLLTQPPIIRRIRGVMGDAKGRPLDIPDIKHMLGGPEYLSRFIILSLGTGARPNAVLDLDWEQVDFAGGVIRLNPIGRSQTKKRRADVPMCDELKKILLSWGPSRGPVITYRGKRVVRVKTAWERTREGLRDGANPYSLRHTVARWLRSKSVPIWEVAALLGHKRPGHTVTEMYAAADPNHMHATKLALGELLRANCVTVLVEEGALNPLILLERANGFEPSTLTLAR
jgi:integrase